jgi:gamma-glutamylputrescine oxidase
MSGYTDNHYVRTTDLTVRHAALEGEVQAEVCVIGGGMAGLATALDLAERGRSVVLLERHRVGFGASGRNGGFVVPGYPTRPADLAAMVGPADARELYTLTRGALALILKRIAAYGMDVGELVHGRLIFAMAEDGEAMAANAEYMAKYFGRDLQVWSPATVRQHLATTRYSDGALDPEAFSLDPLKLVRGTAAAFVGQGGRIHEDTPATGLRRAGGRQIVATPGGRVVCEQVVMAGGGYVGMLDWKLGMATIPVPTYVMVTEPLGENLRNVIGTKHSLADRSFATNYYRPLADGRLLWGGRVATLQTSHERMRESLHRDMAWFYPDLARVKVDVAWGGLMPYLRHRMPMIGAIGAGRWVATGFGGLGMGITTMAGNLIASAITEGDTRWQLFRRFGLPFAGGPVGRAPALMIYWAHQARGRLARGVGSR